MIIVGIYTYIQALYIHFFKTSNFDQLDYYVSLRQHFSAHKRKQDKPTEQN